MRSDKAATPQMRTQVLAAQANIKRIATTITEETSQFFDMKTEAETRLRDQSEAISVDIGRVEAHLKTTKKLFTEGAVTITELEDGKEQGNKTIRAIVMLQSTEQQIKDAKKRLKEYGNRVLTMIEAQIPTSTVAPLFKDIDDIQQELTKSKKFWTKAKTVIQMETTNQIKKIQTQVKEIFNSQRSGLQSHVEAINSTTETTLHQHNQRVEEAIYEMRTERTNHMTVIGSRKQAMDNAHKTALSEFNSQTTKFQYNTNLIVKEACDKIDIAAVTIKDELEETVENHLQSEPMKRVISSNALNCFTKICDSNVPNVVEKVEATAKEILESDTWLKEYVQTIAARTVVYDKLNVQALVDSTV